MVQIVGHLEMGRSFFSGVREDINGGVSVEDLQSIAADVAKDFEGDQINVKNVFDVMKQVFTALDEVSSSLSETRRKDIAAGIIHHVMTLNRSSETQGFADRALNLLIDYSIDAIAAETLNDDVEQKPVLEEEVAVNALQEDQGIAEMAPEITHEDSLSRSRIEEAVESTSQETFLTLEEPVDSPPSVEQEIENVVEFLEEIATKEIRDEIEVPSSEASVALTNAAAQNSEVIDKQTEEAVQYIRTTTIEVDEKIVHVQDEINKCIDQALNRVDQVRDQLKEVLEGAQNLSLDTKGKVVEMVNELAEKLIETIEPPKVEQVSASEEEVVSQTDDSFSQAASDMPIQEIIAGQ